MTRENLTPAVTSMLLSDPNVSDGEIVQATGLTRQRVAQIRADVQGPRPVGRPSPGRVVVTLRVRKDIDTLAKNAGLDRADYIRRAVDFLAAWDAGAGAAVAQGCVNITEGLTEIEAGSRIHKAMVQLCNVATGGGK